MPKLPPGPSFILRQLFSWEVASYSGFVYFLRVGTKRVGVNVPLWAIISSSVAALPVLFLAQCQFDLWKNRRKARSLGGRLVPTVPAKWPGGIDLIVDTINVFKTGYIGELGAYIHDGVPTNLPSGDEMVDWFAAMGAQTVDMRILCVPRVRYSSLLVRPISLL